MASLQVGIAEDHVIEVPRPEPTVVGTPRVSHMLFGQSGNNVVQVRPVRIGQEIWTKPAVVGDVAGQGFQLAGQTNFQ